MQHSHTDSNTNKIPYFQLNDKMCWFFCNDYVMDTEVISLFCSGTISCGVWSHDGQRLVLCVGAVILVILFRFLAVKKV